jgi:hypothetical protein
MSPREGWRNLHKNLAIFEGAVVDMRVTKRIPASELNDSKAVLDKIRKVRKIQF